MIITLKNCLVPDCQGVDHKWEFERPTLRELQRISRATGMDVEQWTNGLNEALGTGLTDAAINACLALVDILHRRDGVRVAFDDIDVDLADFDIDIDEADTEAEDTDEGRGGADASSEGKDPAPTTPSPREGDADPASTSGRPPAEESTARSSTTPPTSGGTSDSP